MRLSFLTIVLLSACGIPQEDLGEKAGEAWCKRARQCGDIEREEEEDCVSQIANGVDLVVNLGESFGEEYDAGGAGACVREVRSLSCDEMDTWSSEDCRLFKED